MFAVYGKSNCIWCKRAIKLLEKSGENFLYYDITLDPLVYEAFRKYFPDAKTVPQIVLTWNDSYEIIGGYDDLAKYFG